MTDTSATADGKQIDCFLSFATEDVPFPFSAWPSGTVT